MGTTTSSLLAGENSLYSIFLPENSLTESQSETIIQLTSLKNSEETHTIAIMKSDENTLEITYDEKLSNSIPEFNDDTWVILNDAETQIQTQTKQDESQPSEEPLFDIPLDFTPQVPEPVYFLSNNAGFQHSFQIFEEYIEEEKPQQKELEDNIEDGDWVVVEEDLENFKDVLENVEKKSKKKAIIQNEVIKSLQDQITNLMQKMEQVERINQSMMMSSSNFLTTSNPTFYSCSDMSAFLASSMINHQLPTEFPVNTVNNTPLDTVNNTSNINSNYINNLHSNNNNNNNNQQRVNNPLNNNNNNNGVYIANVNNEGNNNNNNQGNIIQPPPIVQNVIHHINISPPAQFPPISHTPPPPPPPLPTQQQLNCSKAFKISTPKDLTPKVKTVEDIKKLLAIEIDKSDISDANKEIALANYLRSFSSENALKFLDFMVTSYGRLIQTLPLQPKTAFNLIKIWEANLFSKIDDQIQRDSIRKRKMSEICLKRNESEILEEIKKVKQFLELQKKEAAEKLKRDSLKKNLMGDLLVTLEKIKQRNVDESHSELENLEECVIDDTDIQL